jgi:hypothetical protein
MAELKTKKTKRSVRAFIDGLPDPQRRKDCRTVMKLMREVTGERPAMWGTAIVGYGSYGYRYASGRVGEWFLTGFSPRKQALTLYVMSGFTEFEGLLARLGTFKTGKACLYVRRLEDIDLGVLRRLVERSVRHKRRTSR